MQKARIKIKINDHIIEGIGHLNKEKLYLKTDEEEMEFDLEKLILIKKNKELIINMNFINKVVTYTLVEEKNSFTNNLIIFSLTNHDKQVMINYQIENTSFRLEIKYETI